jgi:hypothetical protein
MMKSPYAYSHCQPYATPRFNQTYLRETISIKDKRMKQLPTRHRKDQPTPPPPRPLLFRPNPALILCQVIRKLRRSTQRINRNSDSELITWVDRQHEPRQTGSHCRREIRSKSLRRLLIPQPKGSRFRRKKMCAQTCKEAEEYAMQE